MDQANLINFVAIAMVVILFLLTSLIAIRMYQRRNKEKIRANFIYEDRSITVKKYSEITDKILYDDIEYNYDDNLSIRKKGVKNIFYLVGQNDPIDLHNVKESIMSYADYKKVIKSKVLNDLLHDDDEGFTKGDKVLLVIMLGGFGILLIALFILTGREQAVFLSPALKQFIVDAVTTAIKG